jgi:molybdopterin/thiamine biosynthesis adenylyltransferase
MEIPRYIRNHKAISEADQATLQKKCVLVVGCGGLGGYVIESLGRLGVGRLVVVDGDVFDETNLNRQLLSSNMNLGKPKALAAQQRMQAINPLVKVEAHQVSLTELNAPNLMQGCDLVVDALDNIPSRMVLIKATRELDIPLVHGAIAGWYGQVYVVQPGDKELEMLYDRSPSAKGAEVELGNLAFTAALVASIQAAEAVKLLLGVGKPLEGLLQIDLLHGTVDDISLT